MSAPTTTSEARQALGSTACSAPAFVYLLECRRYKSTVFKVGIATDIRARVNMIRCHCPLEINQVYYWEFSSRDNALSEEANIHHSLRQYHERGEWYRALDVPWPLLPLNPIILPYGKHKKTTSERLEAYIKTELLSKGTVLLSQRHIHKKLGISPPSLRRYLRGVRSLDNAPFIIRTCWDSSRGAKGAWVVIAGNKLSDFNCFPRVKIDYRNGVKLKPNTKDMPHPSA